MSFSNFYDTLIKPENDKLERMLYDRETQQFLCPSYYDDDNVLQACSCGDCK